MTIVEVMDNLKAELEKVVQEYHTDQPSGIWPIAVYAGFPPERISSEEGKSFIYCLVHNWEDSDNVNYSTVDVEIGFSIYDEDSDDGIRSLYNVMEHVRQHLLSNTIIAGRNALKLPLKGTVSKQQPYPNWLGVITATYSIGQPEAFGGYYGNENNF